MNAILLSDSYKFTHWKQYPPGTQKVYSYFESRGGLFPETVFFGLQYILDEYLSSEDLARRTGGTRSNRVTWRDVVDADELCQMHFGRSDCFNREGWMHICRDHEGRIPLSIRAVPEGSIVPTGNVLMTVENTCPQCYWVTNFFETLLVQAWYPTTVATLARHIRRTILRFLEQTGDPGLINFKLHDFGFRGVSSVESAGIGGAAQLTAFDGTDTFRGITLLRKHGYNEPMAGFSVPASEHSTITSWGREHEVDAFRNMLEQYGGGIIACVSDSFDIFAACRDLWGGELRDKVLERDGVLVVRPDSGEPIARIVREVLATLGDAFGTTTNGKGYKVLNPHVRVIQGDGVNAASIEDVLRTLAEWGWSADNIGFGMGGALLQKLDRDTQKFAFKCSYIEGIESNGARWQRDVFKEPKTDPGKNSKRGRLVLMPPDFGPNRTLRWDDLTDAQREANQLIEVFRDGQLLVKQRLSEIRARARA